MQEIIYEQSKIFTSENVETVVKRLSAKLADDFIIKRNSREIQEFVSNASPRTSLIIINKRDSDAWDDAVIGDILNLLDSENETTESKDNNHRISNSEDNHVINSQNDDKLDTNDSLLDKESVTQTETEEDLTLQRTPSNLSRRSSIHRRRSTDSHDTLSKTFTVPEKIIEETEDTTGTTGTTDTTNITTTKRKFSFTKRSSNSISKGLLRKIFNRNVVQSSPSIKGINQNNKNLIQSLPKSSSHVDHVGDPSLLRRDRREIVNTAYIKDDDNNNNNDNASSNNKNISYSNFYLAMPNGQWMVRTRTASKKILSKYLFINKPINYSFFSCYNGLNPFYLFSFSFTLR